MRDEILKEAKRVEESARYASETQFAYAKRWRRADRWIGGAASILAATSGVGGLADAISGRWAGLLAVLAAVAAAVAASLGAPKTKEKAAIAANGYRALQQDSRLFINVDLPDLPESEARERLQSLVERLQTLNREADIPSGPAWKEAKRNLEGGTQAYEVDKK